MKKTKLTLDVEQVAVLTDEQAAQAVGGLVVYGNGTLGCTTACQTSISASCDTSGCMPTSNGCKE